VRRVWKAIMVLGVLVGVGTIGYYVLEDMTLLDALYMTVTTISTVGFGEVHPLSHTGRAFTSGEYGCGSLRGSGSSCMVEASHGIRY